MTQSYLTVEHLQKVYKSKENETIALQDVNFGVKQGEFVAIMGESGSGKSTLLNILATFDQATAGHVLLNEQDLSQIKAHEVASFRRDKLGFVFQDFNLLDTFTNQDNILLPLVLAETKKQVMHQRLEKIASFLGIEELLEKYPYQISGGQAQRIAIARALITQPEIILADEPTGSLDSRTAANILNIFKQMNQTGNTILMVTHSVKAAASAERVLFIRDGIIFHEVYRGSQTDQDFHERIAESLAMVNQPSVDFHAGVYRQRGEA